MPVKPIYPIWRLVGRLRLLLEAGKVDAESKGRFGQTPLSRSAKNGHEAVVRQLLDSGKVHADSKDNGGRTPLWWAAQNGRKAAVKFFEVR